MKSPVGKRSVPTIDLFAGPGGLSEGFSRFEGAKIKFDVRLSIEKDEVACRTLQLRAFVRQFNIGELPDAYYEYIKGNKDRLLDIKKMREWKIAAAHVCKWTLGEQDQTADGYVSHRKLHNKINEALGGATTWVLLGGPPCQAYSLVGRSRMTGIGTAGQKKETPAAKLQALRAHREEVFSNDRRHTLYREYLRVVAVHQPAAFVMENVKGILSARLPKGVDQDEKLGMFGRIRRDLEDPWRALEGDPEYKTLDALRDEYGVVRRRYKLVPLSESVTHHLNDIPDTRFLVRAERYGVPQKRHRVIVLGIRDDLVPAYKPLGTKPAVHVRAALAGVPAIRSQVSFRSTSKYGDDSASSWCRAIEAEGEAIGNEIDDVSLKAKILSLLKRKTTSLPVGEQFMAVSDGLDAVPSELRSFLIDRRLGGVTQHYSRSHMASDLVRYLYLSTSASLGKANRSPTLEKWPKALLPQHANVRHVRGNNVVGGFSDRFRVQVWDQPSSTITSHLHKDGHYFIHPDPRQCRSLSLREAARLQTFPENYYFEGNRTQTYLQVGNAVPPYLAVQLAECVASMLLINSIRLADSL